MNRFELPADTHPVSLDCPVCESSIIYSHDVAECLHEHGCCCECRDLAIEAEAEVRRGYHADLGVR